MGFFKKLFGLRDHKDQDDKVLVEKSVSVKVNGKTCEIPVRITEGSVRKQQERENDKTMIEESQTQIKSVKKIGEYADTYKGQTCPCIVSIQFDNNTYEIKADLTREDYENFDKERLQRRYYTRLPNKDEVAIPINTTIKFFVGNDEAFHKFQDETFRIENEGCKFFPLPQKDFVTCYNRLLQAEKDDMLLRETATLNNKGIALEKEGKIDEAISIYEKNVSLGYLALHSYDRLIVLYHKKKDVGNEIRIIEQKLAKFGSDKSLQLRLEKLKGTYIAPQAKYPTERLAVKLTGTPLGDEYEEAKLRFGEFNFYANDTSNDDFLSNPNKEIIWRIHASFKKWMDDAKAYEQDGNYIEATKVYETLVANHYYLPAAYDRLIKIYSKAKLKNVEMEVLKEGILYFTTFRKKQKEYVQMLATKYGAEDFFKERVDNGGKITYYNGAFELYNSYTIIDKWQERLEKLKK